MAAVPLHLTPAAPGARGEANLVWRLDGVVRLSATRRWTQEALAEIAGISANTLRSIHDGRCPSDT
jgi:hypothetical protein